MTDPSGRQRPRAEVLGLSLRLPRYEVEAQAVLFLLLAGIES